MTLIGMSAKDGLKFIVVTALASALACGGAQAQDPGSEAPAPEDEKIVEEVVVTGTRIKRRDFESPSPLVTIDREALEFSGQPTLEEYLNQMPQMQPDFGRASNNPGNGTAALNLRGLGPGRTLVLLNGRRVAPSGVGSAVDVNNLPRALVQRVEIITGGASTVYGSDAVAGVVNFITRDDLVGFAADSSYSISEEGDANIFDVNLTWGMDLAGGEGNIAFYASYYDRDPLFASERALSSQPYIDSWEGFLFVGGSSSTPEGLVANPPVDLGDGPVRMTFNPDGTPRAYDSREDAYNYAPVNYLQVPMTRYSAGLFGSVPVSDAFEAYFEAAFTRNEVLQNLAPVPLQAVVTVNTDNPVLTAETRQVFEDQLAFEPGYAGFVFFRRMLELGPRIIDNERDYTRLVAGIRGDLGGGWDVDAWVTWTESDETEGQLNGASRARLLQGLLVDPATGACFDPTGGCVPLDMFGAGRLSAEGADFVRLTGVENQASRRQTLASVVASGAPFSTWAGPVGTAFGLEWRKDEGDYAADPLLFSNDVLGYFPTAPVSGSERVWEAYAEAVVPLLGDASGGQYLGLELGARYSDYENAGSVNTWKAGVDWRPLDTWRLRAMAQRSVRAPNLQELFLEPVASEGSVYSRGRFDPCSASNDPVGNGNADKCVLQGLDPALVGVFEAQDAYPATVVFGGNPNLVPEEADTLTAGFVWTPARVEGLTLAVDWFDMEITDTIGDVDPRTICFDTLNTANLFCDDFRRDGTGHVVELTAVTSNRGVLGAEGVDTQVLYVTDLPTWAALPGSGAQLRVNAIWTHMMSNESQDNPVTEIYDCAGYYGWPCAADVLGRSFPADRVFTTFDYASGRFSGQLTWQWIDSMRNAAPFASADFGYPDPDLAIPSVSSYQYFDLGLGWQATEDLHLRFVVSNLFDKEAPNLADAVGQINTDAGLYDVFGRSYYLSVAWQPGR